MDAQIILEELKRRESLIERIDYIIIEKYRGAPSKLKRGEVHQNIAKELDLTLNNFLYTMILDRMKRHGFRCATHRGTQYFIHKT